MCSAEWTASVASMSPCLRKVRRFEKVVQPSRGLMHDQPTPALHVRGFLLFKKEGTDERSEEVVELQYVFRIYS